MSNSTNLDLPYIMPAQAQKHVTHNEALRMLDAIVHLAVSNRDLAGPPANPVEGERFIVAAPAAGDWAGQEGNVAAWQDGAWAYFSPQAGWLAHVADENVLVVYNDGTWQTQTGGTTSLNPAQLVGVNSTADETNRLSVSSPATLLNHQGNGHQLKINKASATDTASMLFQTGFSGRAEMGTTGDDDFHFKVSPDGATFYDAIVIDRTNGEVSFPNTTIEGAGGGDHSHSNLTILDATSASFTSALKSKLDGVETGATADRTDAEIETAYNNQVAQVSSAEITNGAEIAVRRFSPADVHAMIDAHAPAGGGGGGVNTHPGLRYIVKSGTTSASVPFAGIRFNTADQLNATQLFLDYRSADSVSSVLSLLFNAWGDGTAPVKGYLYLRSLADSTTFRIYELRNTLQNGATYTFEVVQRAANGTFAVGDEIAVSLERGAPAPTTHPGFRYIVKPETTAGSATIGSLRFNTANQLGATQLFLDFRSADASGVILSGIFNRWGSGTATEKGLLYLRSMANSESFRVYALGAANQSNHWFEFDVQQLAANGTFATNENVAVSFERGA